MPSAAEELSDLIGNEELNQDQEDAINTLTPAEVQCLKDIHNKLAGEEADGFEVGDRDDDKEFFVGIC